MTDPLPTIRIFISSPSDVRPERIKAEQIIARLNYTFAYRLKVEAVLWEREPLVATYHFQDPRNIPQVRGMDIVVVILWSQLGMPLPSEQFHGAISGGTVTGTEWEFEDALASARERATPDLLLYRKTATPVGELKDRAALQHRLEQLDMVEAFFNRWFRGADDKSLVAALHTFGTTAEFEDMLYEHLRELLERRVGVLTDGIAIHWHDAPFRGLLSFEYEHAPVFFGRTRARHELRELLARREAAGCAFVMVLGASGSGKSSLVKAGLLPDLRIPGMVGRVGHVRWAVLRPSDAGGELFTGLAQSILSPTALPELVALQYTNEQLSRLLREAPGQAALPIRQGLAAAGATAGLTETAETRLALIVDQFEELFTLDSSATPAREAFIAAIEALAKSGCVWIVTTMRSDFFDRIETLPALASLSAEGRFLLLPPNEFEIGQIVRQPAMEAGLRYELDAVQSVGLDEIIRLKAARASGSLPLLSFLLDQLWLRRSEAGLLTFAAYQELGGLEGAIGRRAEDVFLDLPAAVRSALPAVLRALASVRDGVPTARAVRVSDFPSGSAQRSLIDALLVPEARLLVIDADADGAQIRLAHEALLTHWPRALDLVAADMHDLELRGRLEQAAATWQAAPNRQKNERVITGLMLAEARNLLARWGSTLPQQLRDFIGASRRAARRRRVRLCAAIAGAVVALPTIAGAVWAAMVWRGVAAVEAEMAFVSIPAGCFEMGSPDSEPGRFANEGPVHRVCLQAFAIGQFEVTQAQWRRVMIFINPRPSYFKGDERRPVESVSWNEAAFFVNLMSFFGHRHYRVPSEAEWEYVARAGTTTARYWGESADQGCSYENLADQSLKRALPDAVVANCDDGFATPAPVGSFKPNPFGVYDILGNVAEWVDDCYRDYRKAPESDGDNCQTRVVRGGAWNVDPRFARAANRSGISPNVRSGYIGFRLARSFVRPNVAPSQ